MQTYLAGNEFTEAVFEIDKTIALQLIALSIKKINLQNFSEKLFRMTTRMKFSQYY